MAPSWWAEAHPLLSDDSQGGVLHEGRGCELFLAAGVVEGGDRFGLAVGWVKPSAFIAAGGEVELGGGVFRLPEVDGVLTARLGEGLWRDIGRCATFYDLAGGLHPHEVEGFEEISHRLELLAKARAAAAGR